MNIEPAAKFVALSEKRADAVPDYTTGQPFWEKAVGKDNLVRMPWYQHGFDTYSMSIMASEKTINERPKVLKDFLEASYRGWRDVMENPKAALAIFQKRVPEIDLTLIEPNMMLGLELMKTRALREERHRLDGSRQDVPHRRAHQHLHGRAPQGRLRRGVHQLVPHQDRAAREHALAADACGDPRPGSMLIELDGVGMTYVLGERPRRGAGRHHASAWAAASWWRWWARRDAESPRCCGSSPVSGRPPRGRARVEGRDVLAPLPAVGMVFQAPVLLRWRRLLDNVLLPVDLAGLERRADYRERARELLRTAGLADFAEKYPRELSGGMQQRASLCRALILDPPILLMDEPFGALDAMTRDEMNLELLRVWGETAEPAARRKTVLFVTHSIPEAVFLADRVVVMTPRPGRVARMFDVALPRPRTMAQRADPAFGRLALEIYETLMLGEPQPQARRADTMSGEPQPEARRADT